MKQRAAVQAIAKQAWDYIQTNNLSPAPFNFELWFVYFAKSNPDVTATIDRVLDHGKKLTDDQCNEIFLRFISEDHNSERIIQAGDQVFKAIQEITERVEEATSVTTQFQEKLETVQEKLQTTDDVSEVRKIARLLASDTQNTIQHNRQLESQLVATITHMETLQQQLDDARREALTDSLTGISNRKSFDSELGRTMTQSLKDKSAFSLLMIDIDHFKRFNDNYGHQIGDQVLRLVAKTLKDGVKGRDIAARYGGEEFAIILPETGLMDAASVATQLVDAVAKKDIINKTTGEVLGRVTMSVGLAEFDPAEDADELLARADAALYTAKHNGRNQVATAPASKSQRLKKTKS